VSLKRLAKESLIYGLSRYISKFISIFLLPLYTAVLTPEDYGIIDLLSTVMVVSTFLIISGTDSAIGYFFFRKESENDRPAIITTSLILRLLFSGGAFIIILIAAPLISNILFGRDYSLFLKITAFTIVFSTIHSFIFDLLRLEFRPWLYTIISTSSILLNILLTILYVLILKKGVYGALVAQAFAYGIVFVYTIIYVFKKYGYKYSKLWSKRILAYGFPLIGTGVAMWVLSSTDRYFLAHYTDLTSVGIYAVGMKLASLLGMLAGALQLAWGPYALGIQYENNAKIIYSKVFLVFFIINTIGIFAISMFSIDILKVFTQPNYYSAKAVVPFLCLSTVLSSGYFIVSIGINITKKLQHTIWITISAALLNIILNFLLTPLFGVIGASFSIMIANLLIFVLTLIISNKYYPVPYDYLKILYIFIPSAIIVFISYYYNLRIIPRSIISLLYFITAGIFLYSNFKDSEDFRKLIMRAKHIGHFRIRQPDHPNIDI
jgi:O-antigen/teichoic acid export membrane protein